MLVNPSVLIALSLTNIAGFISYTSKLINDIGLKKFREGVLTLGKLLSFKGENAMLMSMFSQKRSQICLYLIFFT